MDEIIEYQHKILPDLGFVGAEWVGRNQQTYLNDNKLLNRICLFEPYPTNLNYILEASYKFSRHESYESLLSNNVKGVVIATPGAMHAEQVIHALEKGKAVFCQKPLGISLDQTRQVIEVAKNTNKLLAVDYSCRNARGIKAIKKILERKILGEIFTVQAVFHNANGPDKKWFYDPVVAGSGCLMDLGSHLIDVILYLFPKVEMSVRYARLLSEGKPCPKHKIEDYAETILQGNNNIVFHLSCSWKMAAGKDVDFSIKVTGTNGAVCFHNVKGSLYHFKTEFYEQQHKDTMIYPPDKWEGSAIQNWVETLALDDSFDKNNLEMVVLAQNIENIYAAARSE